MIWGYITLFFISTVKYITAPFLALTPMVPNDNFFFTWIVVVSAGLCSVTFFYYLAEYFMERNRKKLIKKGIIKRKFTRMNKLAVKIKLGIGIYGLALLTASFLSIPLGAIICAKFFGHEKKTIFVLYASIILTGTIMTSIVYLFWR